MSNVCAGDRHPSNIMLHRVTGKVLHIDFGDCFEVTFTREKFPEKIPFRLTRMMINAMEVFIATETRLKDRLLILFIGGLFEAFYLNIF